MSLTEKTCRACRGDEPPLRGEKLRALKEKLGESWKLSEERYLEKEYAFPDFKEALGFTVKVGSLAEEEGHHPDIYLSWGRVRLKIWTHKIEGLMESDFILAAKCDRLFKPAS